MMQEVPFLREAATLSHRLFDAAKRWEKHRHRVHRRVSWLWRHSRELHEYKAELSLFSTIHLGPRFHGREYPMPAGLICPEIAFDDDGRIVDVERIHTVFGTEF